MIGRGVDSCGLIFVAASLPGELAGDFSMIGRGETLPIGAELDV